MIFFKSKFFLIASGLVITGFDWFILSIWQWVAEHNTCIMMDMTGKAFSTICWGVSPFPLYILTFISIVITLSYCINLIEYFRSKREVLK